MNTPSVLLGKSVLENCLDWFLPHLRQTLIGPLQRQFPNFPLPTDIAAVQRRSEQIRQALRAKPEGDVDLILFVQEDWKGDVGIGSLLKQAILLYRRNRATFIEGLLAKTHDPEMAAALRQEVDQLDAAVGQEWFQQLRDKRIPKLKDILPLQLVEESAESTPLPPRAYDEKFRILYAPTLFLSDLAYYRAKCESRDVPVAVAFVDIDDFKRLNEKYNETFIDRNLLPRFMQTIEAHVYQHGYAYRQGGDEYLILLPSLSKELARSFIAELCRNLAALSYPGIQETLTVSVGLCIAKPDCPLTDRELLERANQAKKEAKKTRRRETASSAIKRRQCSRQNLSSSVCSSHSS